MENSLFVWVYLNGVEPVLCGRLDLIQGRQCVFSYDPAWLSRSDAFALSPDIPLKTGVMVPVMGLTIHPVFEDSGPDRWGRAVIHHVFNPLRRSPLEYLMFAGNNRIGAMGFSLSREEAPKGDEGVYDTLNLPDLLAAAKALSQKQPIDERASRLLRPGSKAGGARPKAIIKRHGEDWIAKFPSEGDECDVSKIEHASLVLARQAGIEVARSDVLPVGNRHVFLVKRFDRNKEGCLHLISARTLLMSAGIAESDMGYGDIADGITRLSSAPEADCHALFRRMVFNVLIENTDDHEKNHAFLLTEEGWRLSPAYDVLPQCQGVGYQQLRVGSAGRTSSIANAMSEAARFLLKPGEATKIVQDVLDAVSHWKDVFLTCGVSDADIEVCSRFVLRPSMFEPDATPAEPNKNGSGNLASVYPFPAPGE